MKKDLRVFLALQLASTIVAMTVFKLVEVRWQAGLIAGSGFVFVGVWMVLKTLRWPERFRYASFYLARAHLWLFALPMILVQFRFFGADFAQVHFLGIPGPQFHRMAEITFLVMVVGTGVDLYRVRKQP